MRIEVITFIAHLVSGEVRTINCPKYHLATCFFETFEQEGSWEVISIREVIAMDRLLSHFELIGRLIELVGCGSTGHHNVLR